MNGFSRREILGLLPCVALGCMLPASAGACGMSAELRAKRAIARGANYLVGHQSADGAWRSSHYGVFREGDVLTPLVLVALSNVEVHTDAIEQGERWLRALTDRVGAMSEPWDELHYPLFTASYAARFFARRGDTDRAAVWANCISALQLSSALGWSPTDPRCGAWSDAPQPPQFGGTAVPDMLNPNISATAMAVLGLVATGRVEQARQALPFLQACQNWREHDLEAMDDGGFFFALDDPVRNKAGAAGKDRQGRMRYRSYGSATCDGLLSMMALGAKDQRIGDGLEWLRSRLEQFPSHPGNWPDDRKDSGRGLIFYYAQAFAEVLRRCGKDWAHPARVSLAMKLAKLQAENGSWQNEDPESCEDDPIVATAFAMHALVA